MTGFVEAASLEGFHAKRGSGRAEPPSRDATANGNFHGERRAGPDLPNSWGWLYHRAGTLQQ